MFNICGMQNVGSDIEDHMICHTKEIQTSEVFQNLSRG